MNDGTELRITNIRHSDLSDYTCRARNGEGQISHTLNVVMAGICWLNNYCSDDIYNFSFYLWLLLKPLQLSTFSCYLSCRQVSSHPSHMWVKLMWSLFLKTTLSDPARVVFTPTIQYLPLHLSGVIHCHIESHPPFTVRSRK